MPEGSAQPFVTVPPPLTVGERVMVMPGPDAPQEVHAYRGALGTVSRVTHRVLVVLDARLGTISFDGADLVRDESPAVTSKRDEYAAQAEEALADAVAYRLRKEFEAADGHERVALVFATLAVAYGQETSDGA